VPQVPSFDKEAEKAVEYEGLPPLEPTKSKDVVVFTNVRQVFKRQQGAVAEVFRAADGELGQVIVRNGSVVCHGQCLTTSAFASLVHDADLIDLRGGSISPGLTTFGSPLGLVEIDAEPSTNDGVILDPLSYRIPSLLGPSSTLIRAVDGLQFGGRNTLLAYRSGVTKAVTAPLSYGFYGGLSTTFSTGALNKLDIEAIIQEENAVHITLRHFGRAPSVSTQVGVLRRLLLHPPEGSAGKWFHEIAEVCLVLYLCCERSGMLTVWK
jgi:hypothetical protein